MTTWIELERDTDDAHIVDHAAIHLYEVVPGVEMAGTRDMDGRVIAFAVTRTLDRDTILAAEAVAAVERADMTIGPGRPRDGRLVRFPGQRALRGELPVRDVLRQSAITSVEAVGALLSPESIVVARGHVRPLLRDGEIVLHVRALTDGRFEAFELEFSQQCCEVGAGL